MNIWVSPGQPIKNTPIDVYFIGSCTMGESVILSSC